MSSGIADQTHQNLKAGELGEVGENGMGVRARKQRAKGKGGGRESGWVKQERKMTDPEFSEIERERERERES